MDQSVTLGQAPDLNLATTLASLVLVIVIILFLAWVLKKMRLVGVHSSDQRLTIVKLFFFQAEDGIRDARE